MTRYQNGVPEVGWFDTLRAEHSTTLGVHNCKFYSPQTHSAFCIWQKCWAWCPGGRKEACRDTGDTGDSGVRQATFSGWERDNRFGMIWMCPNMRTPSPVYRHFNGQNDDTPSKLRHPLFKQTRISTGDNIISVEDMTRDNGVLNTNRPWTAISPTISESNQKKSWRI